MDFTRTRGADWLAALGGLVLLVSLFLPWYAVRGFGLSGWESLSVIDLVLAVAALLTLAIPLVVAARDASPVPIAVTVIACAITLVALVLVLIRVIWVPDVYPDGLTESFSGSAEGAFDVSRDWGLWIGLLGGVVATVGAWRALRDSRAPGLRPAPEPQRQPVPPAQAAG